MRISILMKNAQLIVAKHTDKAHVSWWRIYHFESNLYMQRGAQTKTASIDDKEDQHEFWKESSVFTPT